MNTKIILTINLLLIMTVVIALGGVWQPASAKSQTVQLVAGQTIGLGGQGLYSSNIPTGTTQVYLDNIGTVLPPRYIYKMDFRYRAPAMEVRFMDARGVQIDKIEALVYIYFNINKTELNLWHKTGMDHIAIWFANEETGEWQMCPTTFVQQSHFKGIVGRLTCLAPGSGYYVLGQGDFSKYIAKPHSIGGVKAASTTKTILSPVSKLPSEEWSWYENKEYRYRIAHPNTWTHIVDWDETWNEQTYKYLVIHRDRSYSETAEVIVDIWYISGADEFDLIDWLNQSEGITLGESNEYNATILGLNAVFQLQPGPGMIGDLAQLIFTDGKFVYRIFFTNGAIPTLEEDIQIFIDSTKSFTLLDGPTGPLTLPSGWEQ